MSSKSSIDESFSQHEKEFKDDIEEIQRWKNAFVDAGKTAAHDLKNYK